MSASAIEQAIRRAAGHEDAAGRHEDRYEQQMKAAGACMYEAFTLALRAAPEFQGRKIDDAAILRIYKSTKPRPWWDAQLKAAELLASGKADRDRAKRLIQWHVDPDAAKGRRAQHALQEAARRKSLNSKSDRTARGARVAPKSQVREERHAERVTAAAEEAAHAGRERPRLDADLQEMMGVSLDDLLREVNRMSSAVKKVPERFRGEVRETLTVTAREVEKYIA